MNEEELLKAIAEANALGVQADEGYYTTEEMATMSGRSQDSVRKALKTLKKAGRLDVAYVWRDSILGQSKVPGYRVT